MLMKQQILAYIDGDVWFSFGKKQENKINTRIQDERKELNQNVSKIEQNMLGVRICPS